MRWRRWRVAKACPWLTTLWEKQSKSDVNFSRGAHETKKASWDAIKYILDPGKKTKAKGSEGIAPSILAFSRYCYVKLKQFKIQTMNVTSVEAELLAIRIGLIPAMEENDTHDIIVITDSISAASKTLKSHVNPFQNSVILLASNPSWEKTKGMPSTSGTAPAKSSGPDTS